METMEELEVKILNMQKNVVEAFKLANEEFLDAIKGLDLSNRSGTNAGNFLMQIIIQANNNDAQLATLMSQIDGALSHSNETQGVTAGGIAPAPARL